jgi:LmeA-like phospholipid-binding
MFSGLTGSKNQSGMDLGERMLNAVASQAIRHLFTESESVDVSIRCFPTSKLLQGSVDSFKMQGRNLVIRREFHVEDMSFETDAVSIDPSKVLGGKIALKQPTQAVAQVVLNQDGINRAFSAELVKKRLQNVDLEPLTNLSGGEPVSFRDVSLQLLPDNWVTISALTDLPNRSGIPIRLKAEVVVEKRRRIVFSKAEFLADEVEEDLRPLAELVTIAFAEVLNGMVDLDRFDLDGVMLRVNRLETHGQKLVFSGYAQIDHFPGSV